MQEYCRVFRVFKGAPTIGLGRRESIFKVFKDSDAGVFKVFKTQMCLRTYEVSGWFDASKPDRSAGI